MSWHLDVAEAHRYADREVDVVAAASIEAHLTTCADCRALVGAHVDGSVLAEIWLRIDDQLDERRIAVGRLGLRRLGLDPTWSRLLTATTATRWSYLSAVTLSLAFAALAALHGGTSAFAAFLVVAPLGPLVAVGTAFGRWSDPAYELLGTVPMSGWRLLLWRVVASVVPALALTALSIPLSIDRGWYSLAWLAP